MKSSSKLHLWLAGLCLALTGCSSVREPGISADQKRLNLDSFEIVWETVRDKHYDPELNDLDWNAIHDEYQPRVGNAGGMTEVRSAMREMLGLLGQSHFGIIPASAYKSIDANVDERTNGDDPTDDDSRDRHGYAGMSVRVLDGEAIVTSVDDGSPGAQSGIKPGWEIRAVNGRDNKPVIESLTEEYGGSTQLDLMLTRATAGRLFGDVGDVVKLRLRDGKDRIVDKELVLVPEPGERTQVMGLPERVVKIDHRWLDGNIGYVRFNGFFHPDYLMGEFAKAMTTFMSADGLVIDLRQNFGGIGPLSMGMAGWLVGEKNKHLGTTHLRNHELKFVVFPRAVTYEGPVAVLTDGLSVSTAEIFAGGLQDLGRARIFGSRTAGAALPSAIERLPNGDGFQYVIANYVSVSGKVLEGVGVIPDEPVPLTRESLLAGRDNVIDAATAWIQTQ
ncbi:MAG: S41 family peptidase [Planctomycetota bacterium]|jgi:carboxyl-terminal processing protease